MKCTILTIGTEILFGSIVNTNAVYLSKQLQALGVDVLYHMTVGDNPKRLKDILDNIYVDCDLIITTGGLGPTQDDLTKETIAEYFGEKLVNYPEEEKRLREWFSSTNRIMTENNLKQAYFPENCLILPNRMGTAPGMMIEKDNKVIITLPGPPFEMRPMFEEQVKPILLERQDSVLYYKMLRFVGIGESALETKLMDLIDGQTDPTLATYASPNECALRIASKRKTYEEAKNAVEEMISVVKERVGEFIYSDSDEKMPETVCRLLEEKGLSLSCAESCTGGLFAKTVTDIPGVSAIFDRGIVTYSNRAKVEELGVNPKTIEAYGAVSEETATEMAEGLHKVTGSDVCVSVTGIAGPGGGSEAKPVGLYYVGLYFNGKSFAKKFINPRKDREHIRNTAVVTMFQEIYKLIK